jgi:hypothetical protein
VASSVAWETGYVGHTADSALNAGGDHSVTAKDDAIEFLRLVLAGEPKERAPMQLASVGRQRFGGKRLRRLDECHQACSSAPLPSYTAAPGYASRDYAGPDCFTERARGRCRARAAASEARRTASPFGWAGRSPAMLVEVMRDKGASPSARVRAAELVRPQARCGAAAVYFRRKTSAGRAYLQIVESRRDGDQVRQQVIATLGRFDELQASGSWSGSCARVRASPPRPWC